MPNVLVIKYWKNTWKTNKRFYTLLNKNNVIFNLQFGFILQYSTSHALIKITDNKRKGVDDGNTGCCRVFVELEKAFDTEYHILWTKLDHCGIRGVPYGWFRSYVSNLNQYVTINGYESGLAAISCGSPQGAVLGPLLFLLCLWP